VELLWDDILGEDANEWSISGLLCPRSSRSALHWLIFWGTHHSSSVKHIVAITVGDVGSSESSPLNRQPSTDRSWTMEIPRFFFSNGVNKSSGRLSFLLQGTKCQGKLKNLSGKIMSHTAVPY
jgi:hypothetical protein